MNKKEWAAIVLLVLFSNALTIFATSKYLIPKPKIVDLVSVLEDGRRADIQKVLEGKMTQDEFAQKHEAIGKKVDAAINAQGVPVFVKQCVMGTAYEDITPLIKAAAEK